MLKNCGTPVLVDFYAVWYAFRLSQFLLAKWMFSGLTHNFNMVSRLIYFLDDISPHPLIA
jgi:hypothetical protein